MTWIVLGVDTAASCAAFAALMNHPGWLVFHCHLDFSQGAHADCPSLARARVAN